MAISVFDIFKIGIGPSSSHTMGPMRAAYRFGLGIEDKIEFKNVGRIVCELYGSLALTGKGHGSDKALMLGLEGYEPDQVDPDEIEGILNRIKTSKKLSLQHKCEIDFDFIKDIKFLRRKVLPAHPNGMQFIAYDNKDEEIHRRIYYSIGGGFVVNEETAEADDLKKDKTLLAFPFKTANDLLEMSLSSKKSIAEMMIENEKSWRSSEDIESSLDGIWQAMQDCMDRGCRMEGDLPGPLKVRRRAPEILETLNKNPEASLKDPLTILDWVNLYALAVNEENACGFKVVTAPTNGAAGIMPAVMRYYDRFCSGSNKQGIHNFLLTSAAIAILYAENASISGAEVGCQGEIGVACSMAAGGLTAALGGTMKQVEQAAEIGMEHNLGLTCDPIGGLVQIPCIERNAMGAVKAMNASRIALRGDGSHHVSLDDVIKTMAQTGKDMQTKYKETSRGGLAVNVSEC
jgi:L-serine dehydratase